jgi:hypothetical protein
VQDPKEGMSQLAQVISQSGTSRMIENSQIR